MAKLTAALKIAADLALQVKAEHKEHIADVLFERVRQEVKWGRQNHKNGTGRPGDAETAEAYKTICRSNTPETDNWRDILSEEVYEAYAESDPRLLREELIQVAAVAFAWLGSIDRGTNGET